MTRLLGLLAVVAMLAALGPAPAAAVRPGSLAGASPSPVEAAQFRFPWENRAKPRKRGQRQARPETRSRRKPGVERPERGAAPNPPADRSPAARSPAARSPGARPRDGRDVLLPALGVPLALVAPRGLTQREADAWAEVAAQVGPTPDPPPIPQDGPGPISAATLAALASLKTDEAIETARLQPAEEVDELETPDIHVPLPPQRPRAPGEAEAERPIDAPSGVGVPLPPRRPGDDMAALEPDETPKSPPGPTKPDIELATVPHDDDPDCRALAAEGIADAEQIPPIEGPGVCGGGPLVSLTGAKRRDGSMIKIRPAATLRCGMARALVDFLRDDVAPAAAASGGELARLDIAGSFQCRGRNGAAGGKMSEHGRANAVDLSGFAFEDGRTFGIFSPDIPEKLSTAVKTAACARFMTVLGPGSDGFHEDHLHIDLQPRRSKSKLCQWADPEVARSETKETDPVAGKAADAAAEDDRDGEKDGREEKAGKPTSDGAARDKTREAGSERSADDARAKTIARRKAEQRDEPLSKRDRTP